MEIVVQIVKQLPPFWPRAMVLIAIAILFFLPEGRNLLFRSGASKRRIDLIEQLMKLRKLELELDDLRSKHPDAPPNVLDRKLEELMKEPKVTEAAPLPWRERLTFVVSGAVGLVLFGTLALWRMDRFADPELLEIAFADVSLAVACGFLGSALPSNSRWECVFRGIVIPVFLGALIITARGGAPGR